MGPLTPFGSHTNNNNNNNTNLNTNLNTNTDKKPRRSSLAMLNSPENLILNTSRGVKIVHQSHGPLSIRNNSSSQDAIDFSMGMNRNQKDVLSRTTSFKRNRSSSSYKGRKSLNSNKQGGLNGNNYPNSSSTDTNEENYSKEEEEDDFLLHVEEERHLGGRLKIGITSVRCEPTGLYFEKQMDASSSMGETEEKTRLNSQEEKKKINALLDPGEARIHQFDLSFNFGSKGSGSNQHMRSFKDSTQEQDVEQEKKKKS